MNRRHLFAAAASCAALFAASCSGDDSAPAPKPGSDAGADASESAPPDASEAGPADASDASDATAEPEAAAACPADMVEVGGFCIDRFEAPNQAGALPLVMYDFDESEAWCNARGKRLCFDDEWTTSCEGAAKTAYPYGDVHQPGVCNDAKTWLVYNQTALNGWPLTVSKPNVETLDALLAAASAVSAAGKTAADEVLSLYQGDGSGTHTGCAGPDGVFDLCGNVEEWTRRRDGGDGPNFSGALKGRYWAESRTCQNAVLVHANPFRFYEIGFRCCSDVSGEP